MERIVASLALCLGFFSRVPLPQALAGHISSDSKLSSSIALFPVAGLVIAIAPATVFYLASLLLPTTVAAGLAIAVGLLVTGALHEDGFADCADGLGATPDRKKALEIMRDSRIGTYGAIALLISVGLRWMALATMAPLSGVLALLIAHSGSRSAITLAMRYSIYARPEGLGQQADGDLPSGGFETAILLAAAIAFVMGWFAGIMALVAGFAFAWLYLKYLEHRLGGFTGDGLGAMQQIAEITILIALAGFWA